MLPAGHAALLVECDGLAEVLALHDTLARTAPPGVVEFVPAAHTLLVGVDPGVLPLESARSWVRREAAALVPGRGPSAEQDGEVVSVPVEYDGDDLHETAALLGVSPEELVAHHTAATWRVAFIGFAPGFGYLVSDDWPFQVPRLSAPRTRVPAGSVALAGAFAGAYPRESPGGWRIVGRTRAVLWDAASDPPALFAPARRVRFTAVRP
jgi:KipI family sensor histidine kinase inhibitor